jgi:Prenyltransferase and squalene oxidase repeat
MKNEALRTLLDAQNPDGGWGAAKGRLSNTESTSLAIIALRDLEDRGIAANVQRGLNWLIERQNVDGSWPFNDVVKGGSWTSAFALLALANLPGEEQRVLLGAKWGLAQEGSRFGRLTSLWITVSGQRENLHLDPDLKGWGWTTRGFSWVEPTSYFLLALKKLRSSLTGTNVDERIRQGERLLYDRMCDGGGWNYGNSKVLGETLWPYPDVTAVALIALQDHKGIEPNNAGLRALHTMLKDVDSGFALSLGIICFSLYGHDIAQWRRKLIRNFEKTGFLAESKTLALYLLALNEGGTVLRV